MTRFAVHDASLAIRSPMPGHAGIVAVDRALSELRRGAAVAVIAGDGTPFLVLAAEGLTDPDIARLAKLAAAPLAVAITRRRAVVLGLAEEAVAHSVSLIGSDAPLTAETVRALADPLSPPVPDSKLVRLPTPEVADSVVALVKLARLLPAAILARSAFVPADMLAVEAGAILSYQQSIAVTLRPVAEVLVPLADAEDTRVISFRPDEGGIEHLALLIGRPDLASPVLARLHSECFTGDLLGSLRCDCGDQLRGAIATIAKSGGGVLLYLAQEGRGIGLVNKLRAYQLQAGGYDTIEANEQLGFDDDERIYLPAVQMLHLLGIARVRLLTNNPAKVDGLERHGIDVVERVPHIFPSNPHNESYLKTKASRGGHIF